jgi:hypothetical protein
MRISPRSSRGNTLADLETVLVDLVLAIVFVRTLAVNVFAQFELDQHRCAFGTPVVVTQYVTHLVGAGRAERLRA